LSLRLVLSVISLPANPGARCIVTGRGVNHFREESARVFDTKSGFLMMRKPRVTPRHAGMQENSH